MTERRSYALMSPARGDASQGTFFETYGNTSFGQYFLCYKKQTVSGLLVYPLIFQPEDICS